MSTLLKVDIDLDMSTCIIDDDTGQSEGIQFASSHHLQEWIELRDVNGHPLAIIPWCNIKRVRYVNILQSGQAPVRSCRVCGCTDNFCRQCIEKTGQPCRWVEPDLCSACVPMQSNQPAATDPETLDSTVTVPKPKRKRKKTKNEQNQLA